MASGECPLRAAPAERFSSAQEIRAYKLGKKRWSYNQVELRLVRPASGGGDGSSDGTPQTPTQHRAAAVRQAQHVEDAELPEGCQESGVVYRLELESRLNLLVHLYAVYAEDPEEAQEQEGEEAGATQPAAERSWRLVRRQDCCRGCEGPLLRPIRRLGRLGTKRQWGDGSADGGAVVAAESEGVHNMKDPRCMWLSIDEACTHVGGSLFRLVAGVYNASGARLLGTAASPPIRVLSNNDVPGGAARIPLAAALPADWEGWSAVVPASSCDEGSGGAVLAVSPVAAPAAGASATPRPRRVRAPRRSRSLQSLKEAGEAGASPALSPSSAAAAAVAAAAAAAAPAVVSPTAAIAAAAAADMQRQASLPLVPLGLPGMLAPASRSVPATMPTMLADRPSKVQVVVMQPTGGGGEGSMRAVRSFSLPVDDPAAAAVLERHWQQQPRAAGGGGLPQEAAPQPQMPWAPFCLPRHEWAHSLGAPGGSDAAPSCSTSFSLPLESRAPGDHPFMAGPQAAATCGGPADGGAHLMPDGAVVTAVPGGYRVARPQQFGDPRGMPFRGINLRQPAGGAGGPAAFPARFPPPSLASTAPGLSPHASPLTPQLAAAASGQEDSWLGGFPAGVPAPSQLLPRSGSYNDLLQQPPRTASYGDLPSCASMGQPGAVLLPRQQDVSPRAEGLGGSGPAPPALQQQQQQQQQQMQQMQQQMQRQQAELASRHMLLMQHAEAQMRAASLAAASRAGLMLPAPRPPSPLLHQQPLLGQRLQVGAGPAGQPSPFTGPTALGGFPAQAAPQAPPCGPFPLPDVPSDSELLQLADGGFGSVLDLAPGSILDDILLGSTDLHLC